jgi:polyisoprenoid-binding protein YceI
MVTSERQTETRTTWAIDPVHSTVEFAVKHMMVSTVRGHFQGISGSITLDEADPSQSSVSVEIDASTVDTRHPDRDTDLRSPNFLEVEKFPTITFQSTKVEPAGGDNLKITGDLTIHGTTRPVVLEAEYSGRSRTPYGTEVIGYDATTQISRKDFGLTWNVALETGGFAVGDTVKITLGVEAVKQD